MVVTYLILCHKNPEQVKQLIELLGCDEASFVIHVDKKSSFDDFVVEAPNIVYIDVNDRVDICCGDNTIVKAQVKMMRQGVEAFDSDYYWLCSGQDLPLASAEEICSYLGEAGGNNFISYSKSKNHILGKENNFDKRTAVYFPHWIIKKRFRVLKRIYVGLTGGYNRTFSPFRRKNSTEHLFYFGSNWMCLRRDVVEWFLDYLDNHPELLDYYEHSVNPDESIFHTLFMMSPYSEKRAESLHYVDWSQGGSNPKVLQMEDVDKAFASGKLFARKFDIVSAGNAVEVVVRQLGKRALARR